MLTFFDYLRQRAFESVLAGAQEALELLESQKRPQRAAKARVQLTGSPSGSLKRGQPPSSQRRTLPRKTLQRTTTNRCRPPVAAGVRTRDRRNER